MKLTRRAIGPFLCVAAFAALILRFSGSDSTRPSGTTHRTIRVAYFPNITHAPALVGIERGAWSDAFPDVRIDSKVVNAGPEAMEALLAGDVDFAFVGPSPAINTYIKSKGKALWIIAGACEDGAALIRRYDVTINSVRDLDGKKLAVPQLGGTQDVSARYFLEKDGLRPREKGGTVEIIPIKNPDILALFLSKQIDAAWVPEPWASKIEMDAQAQVVVQERDLWPSHHFPTTVLVVRQAYAIEHPKDAGQAVYALSRTIDWMKLNDAQAKATTNTVLKRLTGKAIPDDVMDKAWSRVAFSTSPDQTGVQLFNHAAVTAGYLKPSPGAIDGLFQEPNR